MSVRANKNKAVAHQNEIRDYLRTFLCPPLEDDDILSRTMGRSGSDIILTPAAKKVIPFHIECKRHNDKVWKSSYKAAYEQTFCEDYPLLIRRKNRSENHFFALAKDILEIHPNIFKDQELIMYGDLKSFMNAKKNHLSI